MDSTGWLCTNAGGSSRLGRVLAGANLHLSNMACCKAGEPALEPLA